MYNMVQIHVSDGILEGQFVENDIAKFYSFKGIPYAQPPLGEFRFKPPQPVKVWDGVRRAKEHGTISYQMDFFTSVIGGTEDCLYLNVYSPEINPVRPLPVMVWIHGGGFYSGSGDDSIYGPEFIVNNEVVLVTFNYRLEVLGFLCLDSEDVPGNAGMKDQVAALKWVQNNISQFGGDPNNVTIFGESAGGASVSFHLVSPMSKGLFKKAIAQSGAMTNWWPTVFEPREVALALARKLGCDSQDNKELYEFFKKQPMESLINIRLPITLHEKIKSTLELGFCVVDEKDFGTNERFFYGNPYDVLRNGIHENVSVMTGYTKDEGILFLKLTNDLDKTMELINDYNDFLVPRPIALYCTAAQKLEVGRKIKQFYFCNRKLTASDLDQVFKYYSMDLFVYGIMQWAKICSSTKNNKVYLYKFTCESERNILTHIMGFKKIIGNKVVVSHADDLPYLFPMAMAEMKVDKTSETYKVIKNVTKLWTNFAKYGNPTPDESLGVNWIPFDVKQQKLLNISNQPAMITTLNDKEIVFWENIFKDYFPKYVYEDIVTAENM